MVKNKFVSGLLIPFRIFVDGVRSIFYSLGELREFKKVQKRSKVLVLYFTDFLFMKTYGVMDITRSYIVLPIMDRLFHVKKEYHDEKLRPIVVISHRNNRTINVNKLDMEKKRYLSIDAKRVIETKAFDFLVEPSKRTVLVVLIFGVLIGLLVYSMIGMYFPANVCRIETVVKAPVIP